MGPLLSMAERKDRRRDTVPCGGPYFVGLLYHRSLPRYRKVTISAREHLSSGFTSVKLVGGVGLSVKWIVASVRQSLLSDKFLLRTQVSNIRLCRK